MTFNFVALLYLSIVSCALGIGSALGLDDLSSYCTKPGIQCANDQTAILCRTEEDNYVGSLFEACIDGEICKEGTCVIPNQCSSKIKYKCDSLEGMYPDPRSCTKFHYCIDNGVEMQHFESECKNNYMYNPLTTYCDRKLPLNKTCRPLGIPQCTEPGQSGALEENPTIFYTCRPIEVKRLYPYLNACKHGGKYDSGTYSCN